VIFVVGSSLRASAKQSTFEAAALECFVARTPRNDEVGLPAVFL